MSPTDPKAIVEIFTNLVTHYALPGLALFAVLAYIATKIGNRAAKKDKDKK
ncbi:hypothetical protein [Rugamonas sp. DEMB1]|jgi:hypothetical protein|uniref:hypothetical protein n=1 Tax=Rugamonas sp. DEMB1 TaxID=3039386 RepID=UPI00244D48F7|nr:hypothetical protein [Rugamonas sp. DEMB1]WGG51331.1 hypothetical protein QC826_03415 [Rugamonas sp. DEMB1]